MVHMYNVTNTTIFLVVRLLLLIIVIVNILQGI